MAAKKDGSEEAMVSVAFTRALLSLDELARSIPEEYTSKDFKPSIHAFNVMQMGKEEEEEALLKTLIGKLEDAFDVIAPFCEEELPKLVEGASLMLGTVEESAALLEDMETAIERDRDMLGSNPGDLRGLYYRSIHLTENIDLLDRVDEVLTVVTKVESLIKVGSVEQAAEVLMKGIELVMSGSLVRIPALEATRNDIIVRRNTLFDELTDEVVIGVYSGSRLSSQYATSVASAAVGHNEATLRSSEEAHNAGSLESSHDSKYTEEYIGSLVKALKTLGKSEWLNVVEKRVSSSLTSVIIRCAEEVTGEELQPKADGRRLEDPSFLAARSTIAVLNSAGKNQNDWQMSLPSLNAPEESTLLCEKLFEKVREGLMACLRNHMFLISKAPDADPDFSSLKRLWFCIEDRVQELFDAVTISKKGFNVDDDNPNATMVSLGDLHRNEARQSNASMVMRRQQSFSRAKPTNLRNPGIDLGKDFGFIPSSGSAITFRSGNGGGFSMIQSQSSVVPGSSTRPRAGPSRSGELLDSGREDGEEKESNSLQMILLETLTTLKVSVYNIPWIHASIHRLSSDGWRVVTQNQSLNPLRLEFAQQLNVFCEETVTVTLLESLWRDLQTCANKLCGPPRELLKMDSFGIEDDTSTLKPLAMVEGVMRVINEVVYIGANLPDYSTDLGRLIAEFLKIVEGKLYIALGVIEQWTTAGSLLEDQDFVKDMQNAMRLFMPEPTDSSSGDREAKPRSSARDHRLRREKSKAKGVIARIGVVEADQQNQQLVLQPEELKSLVRLVSSVYTLLRAMDADGQVFITADNHTNLIKRKGPSSIPIEPRSLQKSLSSATSSMSSTASLTPAALPVLPMPAKPLLTGSTATTNSSRPSDAQFLRIRERVRAQIMNSLGPSKAQLQQVAERGLHILRVDIQARCLFHTRDASSQASRGGSSVAPDALEPVAEAFGRDLSACDRIVKFNLDVTKREYIFYDLDATLSSALESMPEYLKSKSQRLAPSTVKALRGFVTSARGHCELLGWGNRSAAAAALDVLENTARGL